MTENHCDAAEQQDYLGEYGVVIVPPGDESGSWFVALAEWDGECEEYVAGSDGPLLDTREGALREADKLIDWLKEQPADRDVMKLWQEMQQRVGAEEVLDREWPPTQGPWGDWGRR